MPPAMESSLSATGTVLCTAVDNRKFRLNTYRKLQPSSQGPFTVRLESRVVHGSPVHSAEPSGDFRVSSLALIRGTPARTPERENRALLPQPQVPPRLQGNTPDTAQIDESPLIEGRIQAGSRASVGWDGSRGAQAFPECTGQVALQSTLSLSRCRLNLNDVNSKRHIQDKHTNDIIGKIQPEK